MKIDAIDGGECRKAFEAAGRDPAWLARFLRRYPAGCFLSWVQEEIGKWFATGQYDNIHHIQPGRGERIYDGGLRRVLTDYLIYKAVSERLQDGYTLAGNAVADGAFVLLQDHQFCGRYLSASQIRDRYYRFLNRRTAKFIDSDNRLICGPAKIDLEGQSMIGFWVYDPNK